MPCQRWTSSLTDLNFHFPLAREEGRVGSEPSSAISWTDLVARGPLYVPRSAVLRVGVRTLRCGGAVEEVGRRRDVAIAFATVDGWACSSPGDVASSCLLL